MYRIRRRTMRRRRRPVTRAVIARNLPLRLVRESVPFTLTTASGFLPGIRNLQLNDVPTSDLQGVF